MSGSLEPSLDRGETARSSTDLTPIHFVYTAPLDPRWQGHVDVDANWRDFIDSRQVWLLQTYCILREYYPEITIGPNPRSGAVNVIHRGTMGAGGKVGKHYWVSVRADKNATWWANYEVIQNRGQEGRRAIYITHLPQPGLIRRNPRRSRMETVAFLGAQEQNVLRDYPVADNLGSMGLRYIGMDRAGWNDYSSIDVSLAVRGFDRRERFENKPASKLINAWWAEVPLIAGRDSAYELIGEPGRDYIQVRSYEELLQQIRRLRDTPAYYNAIVERGIEKRARYTRKRVVGEWLQAFEEVIFPDFERWERTRGLRKLVLGATRWTVRQTQRVVRKAL